MPHCLADMADYHRESAKNYYAKGRKTRKWHTRLSRGSAATLLSYSSERSTTPPGSSSEVIRQDSPQTLSYSWPANTEIDIHFVGACRFPAEHQDEGLFGQSPPKTNALRSATGTQQAPAPASLPRPPSSWTAAGEEEITATVVHSDIPYDAGSILANQLKMLLKVQG